MKIRGAVVLTLGATFFSTAPCVAETIWGGSPLMDSIITYKANINPPCWMVMVDADGAVTVDWACVDKYADTYDPKNAEQNAGYAVMFRAIRDGKVKVK